MFVSFLRLSCQHLSSQTTMSLHLQTLRRRLQQSQQMKTCRQTHQMSSLLVRLVLGFLTSYFFHQVLIIELEPNVSLPYNFCSKEKQPEARQRPANNCNTRSHRTGSSLEAPSVQPPSRISSHQLQAQAQLARRRQQGRRTGGELFESPLPAVNVMH